MTKPAKNWLEWTVFTVSTLLIAAVVAVLLFEAKAENSPPDLVLDFGEVQQGQHGYRVPVFVRNTGEQTAEQVQVEVVLTSAGREVEKSEMTFAFVPRKSRREGAVVFSTDPRKHGIEGRIAGYETP